MSIKLFDLRLNCSITPTNHQKIVELTFSELSSVILLAPFLSNSKPLTNMSLILKLVEWYDKRQAKKLAKQYQNDPEVKRKNEELEQKWSDFSKRKEELTNKIQDYIKEDDRQNK